MPAIFNAGKKIVVLKGDKFIECVFIELGITATASPMPVAEDVLIIMQDQEFIKTFVGEPLSSDRIKFLLINLSESSAVAQIIGCTGRVSFHEEPEPNAKSIYFFT